MKTLLFAVVAVIGIVLCAPQCDAASIRIPNGRGGALKIKGHRRALRRSTVSVHSANGFGATWHGARARGTIER